MSDWQVGDLAVCVEGGPGFDKHGIFLGRTYSVTEVVSGYLRGKVVPGLNFAGIPKPEGKKGLAASCFRKVRPDTHEPCEEEFRILLQLSKKRSVA